MTLVDWTLAAILTLVVAPALGYAGGRLVEWWRFGSTR